MSTAPIGADRDPDRVPDRPDRVPHPAGDPGDVARRVAGVALEHAGTGAGATAGPGSAELRDALVRALAAEGLGDRRSRVRTASDVALLSRLLGDGGAGQLDGLARHVGFVLAQPRGVPLWEDLRRLTALLDDLGGTMRAQRRRARLVPGSAGRARGTERVMARAMDAFAATWRSGPRA